MNPIKGLLAIIANYGVGKTTFATECGYHPKDIVFVNDDVKEIAFKGEYKEYVDLVSVSKKTKLLDFHSYCLDLISSLPEAKVIIWDTWTQCQSTFPVYVKANLSQFRNPNEWSAKGTIKAGEIYQESARYEGAVLSALKAKCDLLILTFHLKQMYVNNVALPDKYRPGHDRAIEKYADLRIWLTPNANSQAPIGLVLKNISKQEITDRGIRTSQVLPLRIPLCNWDSILEYWDNPIGSREPIEEERPNTFELSLIDGILTPEDKRLYEASLSLVEQQQAEQQAEELLIRQEQENEIKSYIKDNLDGVPNPAKLTSVHNAISAGELEYNGDVTMARIVKWSR